MSYKYRKSGDKVSRKLHGNSIIRSHLYMFVTCTITRKIKHSGINYQLNSDYQKLRKSVKGKDAITRILFKLTRMLFYELVKETRID